MIILKILCLIFWLLIVPGCMGLLCFSFLEKRHRTPGAALIAGYMLQFGLVELIGIPIVIYVVYNGFRTFVYLLTPVFLLLGGLGALLFSVAGIEKGCRYMAPQAKAWADCFRI